MADCINTSECDKCIHCDIDNSDISKVTIYCKVKKKKYFFGQYIPCENMKKKK